MEIKKHSGIYTLTAEQELKLSLSDAWDFFSSPDNLPKITPSEMGFKITSGPSEKSYTGQIISYKVGIFPLIKSNWVTEITSVKNQRFFVDEQRFGPYLMWHHEHWFEALSNGNTLMRDKISYKLPLGFLGHFAHSVFIKKKLTQIFNYRIFKLNKLFNT